MNQPDDNAFDSGELPVGGQSVPSGIPMARPIGIARPIGTSIRQTIALRLETITVGAAWRDLGVMVLSLIAFDSIFAMLVEWKWGPLESLSDEQFAQIMRAALPYMVGGRALLVMLVIAVVCRTRRLTRESVGLALHGFGKNCFVGVASLGVAWSLIAFCQIMLVTFVPGYMQEATENIDRISGLLPKLPMLGFLALALFVGVYEELLFRGFLLPRLRRATGSWIAAVVISTAVFVAMHLSTQTKAIIVPLSILSITFCLTTIWRKSLIPAIVAHALFDFINFLIISNIG